MMETAVILPTVVPLPEVLFALWLTLVVAFCGGFFAAMLVLGRRLERERVTASKDGNSR